MEFAITKISTKGQIVLPSAFRKGFNVGDELLLVKDNNRIFMKELKHVVPEFKKDLEFAESVESAWKEYDAGKFKKSSKSDFLQELSKC